VLAVMRIIFAPFDIAAPHRAGNILIAA